jgi:hypothetical protein
MKQESFSILSIPTDVFLVVGFISLCISIFGWFVAYKIRRPLIFRIKLSMVFFIPFLLSCSYLLKIPDFSLYNKLLLIHGFILLLSILYWREVKKLTCSIGYHKNILVNFLDMVPDMVWMKDTDNKFTYTNNAVCEKILKCTKEEAFGKTGYEIAKKNKEKYQNFSYGEVCCALSNSDIGRESSCKFIEFGKINNEFIAVQVFKAPLTVNLPDGSKKIVGTIGMGRDLTYDYEDHEKIHSLINEKKYKEAIEAFKIHRDRFKITNCHGSVGTLSK